MKSLEQLAREAGAASVVDGGMYLSGDEALARFRAAVRAEVLEEAALIADEEAASFGGVAAGPMATDRGKLVHEAMAAGAKNAAAAIREAKGKA